MRVLGIDPGSAHVGVAVLEFDDDGKATWVSAWECGPQDVTLAWVGEQIVTHQVDLTAVEIPKPRALGALRQLVATARCAQVALDGAEVAGCERMELTSYEWRKRLCGNSNAKGAIIRYALEEHLDVPKSNDHKRDAAGVALVAGWELFYGRLVA